MENKVSYCDYNSVLVINAEGKLRQVFTPFRVLAIDDSGPNKQVYIVDEVRTTPEDQLVFIINNTPFYHHSFIIDVCF
jgi:hypothetical protein